MSSLTQRKQDFGGWSAKFGEETRKQRHPCKSFLICCLLLISLNIYKKISLPIIGNVGLSLAVNLSLQES